LDLPTRLVTLSLAEFLHPTVIDVRAAWFLATSFTAPSRRTVFTRHPVYLWVAESALVTISPWRHHPSVFGAVGQIDETRDDFICRVVEAVIASHEDVSQQLSEAFFSDNGSEPASIWHQKERRLRHFGRLLDHQLEFVRSVGVENAGMRRVFEQLAGLSQIARYAERRLRESGYCAICGHDEPVGRRCGH
jgi:hypothetical protein